MAGGAGFDVPEIMGCGFTALLEARSPPPVDENRLFRALLSPAGGVAWMRATTAAIWPILRADRRGHALVLPLAASTASALLHASGIPWGEMSPPS